MKKATKTAKTVTFPVPVFTVEARQPHNFTVVGVSGVSISGVPLSVRLSAVRPSLSYVPAVNCTPANYRGEHGKAWAGVPYAVPAMPVVDWTATARDIKARKANRLTLSLQVHEMSLKAVRAVIRRRLQYGGKTANDNRAETWTAYGEHGKTPTGNDFTARLFEYRADINEWYGMESDTAHRASHWERLERLETAERAETAREQALLFEAKEHARKAVQAKRSGDVAVQYFHQRKRDSLRTEARKHHKKATAIRQQFYKELTTTAGDGAELYSVAYTYFWEKLSRDGLTAQSMLYGKGKDRRDYVKTVFQWGFTMVNRSTLGNLHADKQTSAWADYLERNATDTDRENTEDMQENTLQRSPRYWDNTATADTVTTAENVDTIHDLIARLKLSKTQETILYLRLQGYGNDKIAQKLGVSKDTVKTHMKRMRKYTAERLALSPEKVEKLLKKNGTEIEA